MLFPFHLLLSSIYRLQYWGLERLHIFKSHNLKVAELNRDLPVFPTPKRERDRQTDRDRERVFLIDYSLQKSHRPLQNTLYSHKNDYKRNFFSPWPTWERVADLRSPQHFHQTRIFSHITTLVGLSAVTSWLDYVHIFVLFSSFVILMIKFFLLLIMFTLLLQMMMLNGASPLQS